eukprot:g44399.t1
MGLQAYGPRMPDPKPLWRFHCKQCGYTIKSYYGGPRVIPEGETIHCDRCPNPALEITPINRGPRGLRGRPAPLKLQTGRVIVTVTNIRTLLVGRLGLHLRTTDWVGGGG